MKIWLMVLCVFTLGACADSMVTNPASNDAVMTDGLNPDAAMADTSDGKEVDGSDPDTVAEGDLGADAPIPSDVGPKEGGFGFPCTENDDCNSGFCVPTSQGDACTQTCDSDCPEGWSCKPLGAGGDTTFICLPTFINLCRPCLTTSDCTNALGNVALGSRCIEVPSQGWFCGHECSEGTCPAGYVCQETTDKEGETSMQCVAKRGECTCSPYFVGLGAETWCEASNDIGVCEGKRLCTDQGLSACDAQTPDQEVCDGVDNDCNGAVDEATCDDSNVCTSDVCEGVDGCTNSPVSGAACDDGDLTTGKDTCTDAGLCEGTLITCDTGECIVSATPNGTDCDVVYAPVQSACDDGDLNTENDTCDDAGGCQGTLIECPEPSQCTSSYTLTDGVCVPAFALGDSCDDGDLNTENDTCDDAGGCQGTLIECPEPSQCTSSYTLTDGVCVPTFAVGESCSDEDPATVQDTCQDGGECVGLPTVCGDGVVQGLETCEDGNAETETCVYGEKTCTVCDLNCQELELAGTAFCGDGETQAEFEGCDDGNVLDGDGCSSSCTNGSWCGASIQNVGSTSVLIDGQPSGVVPCQGHNPAVSCPDGTTSFEFRSAANNDDPAYDTFHTCVRNEPFDAMLCGTSIMNSGQVSSLFLGGKPGDASLTCKGIAPKDGCPEGYDQLVLSTASTNTDSVSDNVVTCVRKAGLMDHACGVRTQNTGTDPSIFINGVAADITIPCDGKTPGTGACPAGYHAIRLAMTSFNIDA